jgi:hypothetical protein
MPKITAAIACAFLFALSPIVHAERSAPQGCTDATYLSPEQVIDSGDLVVRGTVSGVTPTLVEGHVFTDVELVITHTLRGFFPAKRIVIRQFGGSLNGITSVGAVSLNARVDDEWIVSLVATPNGWWTTYGMTQGAFRIVGEYALRNYRGYSRVTGFDETIERVPISRLMDATSGEDTASATPTSHTERRPGASTALDPHAVPTPQSSESTARPAETRTRTALSLLVLTAILLIFLAGRRHASALRLVLAVVLVGGAAQAYNLSSWTPNSGGELRWIDGASPAGNFSSDTLTYHIITGGPNAMTDEDHQMAFEHAAASWSESDHGTIVLERGADLASGSSGVSVGMSTADGTTQWGGNIGGFSGLAVWSYAGGTLFNADICMNVNSPWSTDGSTYMDFESTALHEFGHAIGMVHSPHFTGLMSYGGVWNGLQGSSHLERRLTDDDHLALGHLYTPGGFSTARGNISGTITENGNNIHHAQIGVIDGDGILVATMVSEHGQFEIQNLPPGTYTLRAHPTLSSAEPWGMYQRDDTISDGTPPTQFLATDSDDISVVVTAGNNTTTAITVTDGNTGMRPRYVARRDGSFWRWWQKGIRLEQGETARLAIMGVNLPQNISELGTLSIDGADVTITGIAFSGDDDVLLAPASDNPSAGQTSVGFNVAVSASAAPGTRAIRMVNTALGERTVIYGFIEIIPEGSAGIALGTNTPNGAKVKGNGSNKVPVTQFSMQASTEEDVRIRSIQVSSDDVTTDIDTVSIYLDNNGNGKVDGSDEELGSATWSGTATWVHLVQTLPANTSLDFLATYTFNGSATGPHSADIPAAILSGVDSGANLSINPLPLSGYTITVDSTAPIVGTVRDGLSTDEDIQTDGSSVSCNWSGFSDAESGIVDYEVCLGSTAGGTDLMNWTAVGTVTVITFNGLAITPGALIYCSVRATNGVGLTSVGTSDGIQVEGTAPVAGTVNDGLTGDTDFQTSTNSISCNWTGFSDPETGVTLYEWCIGTTPGGTDILSWTSVGLLTSVTASVTIANGITYYCSVRATNGAGMTTMVTSDGVSVEASVQTVIASLPTGTTFDLGDGTITGPLTVPAGVTLVGNGPQDTIIVGGTTTPALDISANTASDATITITGIKVVGGLVGIECGAANVEISNVLVYGSTGDGISCNGTGSLSIINCTIADNAGTGCRNAAVIRNCIFARNAGGVCTLAPSGIITYCTAFGNGSSSTDDTVSGIGNQTDVISFVDLVDYRVPTDAASVDAGDPADDYSNEPGSNGSRINQGCYGNTSYAATRSSSPAPAPVTSGGGGGGGGGGGCAIQSTGSTGIVLLIFALLGLFLSRGRPIRVRQRVDRSSDRGR